MKFVIHHQGDQRGPWTFHEILQRIDLKELEWSDYIFDENKRDWILLLDHPVFVEQFRKWKQPPEKPPAPRPYEGAEWYVLRDKNKFGPFSYIEMLQMLQSNRLSDFDYVWNKAKMKNWSRISEVDVFKPQYVRNFKETEGSNLTNIFNRRRHARAKFGASLLLHNNKQVLRGQSIEISAGGAAFAMESDHLGVGQSIFLHFKAGDGVPPFNALCTVVSKTKTKTRDIRYGVKFTSISQTIQQAIKKYTNDAA